MTSRDGDPRAALEALGRPLRLRGDWGLANFTRVAAWIAHGLYFRAGDAGLCEIHTGRAWVDNIEAVARGDVDVTLASPPAFAAMAMNGVGQFPAPRPTLRALAALPHDDAVVFAVPTESPIQRLSDLTDPSHCLTLATAPDDGCSHIGWLCRVMLDRHGVTKDVVESNGGEFIYREFPRDLPLLMLAGHANAVMNEAIMIPQWRQLAEARPIRFLSFETDVIEALVGEFGYRARTIEANRFPGQVEPIETIDFSDWVVLTTTSLPDDLAYALTSIIVENRSQLEGQYSHLPRLHSPLTYPIIPDQMALHTGVPLHDGAREYFAERGLL